MLKEVIFNNYRSFLYETVFTMESDPGVSELENHIYKKNDVNLLRVASIYGPNAGGKSNLLKALNFVNDLKNLNNDNQWLRFFNKNTKIAPFLFDEIINDLIQFSIYFVTENYELGYQLAVKFNLDDNTYIVDGENLVYRKLESKDFIEIFDRKENIIVANEIAAELNLNEFKISENLLFVYYLYTNFVNKTNYNNFYMNIIKELINEFNSIKTYENVNKDFDILFLYKNFYSVEKNKKIVLDIFQSLDISISNIIFEFNEHAMKVKCVHTIDDKEKILPLTSESEGTRKLIFLIPRIIMAIKNNEILLIDEIDTHLHPKLVSRLVELFNHNQDSRAQLIFNSHDILNMNNKNFRRDEIWFAYRNSKMASELVCLSDFINFKGEKVRKDAKYSKQYLEGKFGADPFIKRGVSFYDED